MPSLFIYESITAEGIGRETGSPLHSLYREGRAMKDAITEDFYRVPGLELIGGEFDIAVRRADWTLLIAPETGGELERLARRVLALGGRLLGPSPEAIALTTDKLRLAEHWQRHGVRTPNVGQASSLSFLNDKLEACPTKYPAILKPRDGAGSVSTFLLRNEAEYRERWNAETPFLVQDYVAGKAASIAFLIMSPSPRAGAGLGVRGQNNESPSTIPEGSQRFAGVSREAKTPGSDRVSIDPGGVAARWKFDARCDPSGVEIHTASVPGVCDSRLIAAIPPGSKTIPLLPTFQHIDPDSFSYLGGSLPINANEQQRAIALGLAAIRNIPGLFGYVGVDLILGEAGDGSEDYAIEINPRLTTSYVGLRAAASTNLAGVWWAMARGESPEPIEWKREPIRWTSDGEFLHTDG